MEQSIYCSMIHGGLHLDFKSAVPMAQECCLRYSLSKVDVTQNFWHNKNFLPLRTLNLQNQWSPGCNNCQSLELSGQPSFRTGTNEGLGIYGKTDLSGPVRIDLMFDISCNLACRTCGAHSSTYWQKHLKEHGLWNNSIFSPKKKDEVIDALKKLDLSNLRMLVFCGGETLLGQEYWDVAEWIADNVPNAKQQLTLCFQTNGTQPILRRNYKIINKFFLVKLHVSLDGVGEQFEYLRWPASWIQVTENLNETRSGVPSNVMFLIEETISIFNLATTERLDKWLADNFSTNREGDIVNHTKHLAHGIFSLYALSDEYVASLAGSKSSALVPAGFKENTNFINKTLAEIKKFDLLRNQSFQATFPEVAQHYLRFQSLL